MSATHLGEERRRKPGHAAVKDLLRPSAFYKVSSKARSYHAIHL